MLFWPFTSISVDNNISFLLLALFELYKPPNIFFTFALFHLFVFSLFFLLLFVSIMSPRFVQFYSREMYNNHHSYPCLHCHPHSYIRMVSESLFFFFLSPQSIKVAQNNVHDDIFLFRIFALSGHPIILKFLLI